MSFYAYISVIEAALKLFVIYLLLFLPYDRLFIYSLLLLIVSVIIFAIFFLYVNCKFKTCRYKYVWNKGYFFELISFSGWSMVAGIANMTAHQGGNFLLNMFSGLVANAAFGIANQVSIAIYAFSQNFQIAFSPQITKLYAMSEAKELYRLVFRSTLVSYYLILIIAVPFILKADFILGLWLESVPEYTVGFCVLILSYQLIDAFQAPLNTLIYSTGNIRNYNIWLSIIIFLNLPLAYLFLKSGFTLYIVLFLRAFINLLTAIIRIFYMNVLMDFPVKEYLKNVVMRMFPVTLLSFGIGILLSPIMSGRVFADILYIVVTIFITLLVVLLIGFTKGDREIALAYVKKRFS
jgi:O-antigen/teichoic acid export membrane protein